MLYIQSKVDPLGIGIPYRGSFSLQVWKKNQSCRARRNLARIVDQILHATFQVKCFFKITKLFCIPFKYRTRVISGATGYIIVFGQKVIKEPLLFVLQNLLANDSHSTAFFKSDGCFPITPNTGASCGHAAVTGTNNYFYFIMQTQ